MIWRLAARRESLTGAVWLLVLLMAAVGIGSGSLFRIRAAKLDQAIQHDRELGVSLLGHPDGIPIHAEADPA